jgi:cytochrome c-type biogenesis protein CcmH
VNALNSAEKEAYKEVASELRCLVCQNQSLADSHASLAVDLKDKIVEQVRAGKTKAEIKQYMQDRYGEFVIYKPAYAWNNAVLWAGPFVVLLLAVLLARRLVANNKRRLAASQRQAESIQPNEAAQPVAQWAEDLYSAQGKPQNKP